MASGKRVNKRFDYNTFCELFTKIQQTTIIVKAATQKTQYIHDVFNNL